MKNAHFRMGTLQFTKVLRDTTIDVSVRMDRFIAEHESDGRSARCHLLSVIGNDQEIGAIAAAISDEACFNVSGPGLDRIMISLGKDCPASHPAPARSPSARFAAESCLAGLPDSTGLLLVADLQDHRRDFGGRSSSPEYNPRPP